MKNFLPIFFCGMLTFLCGCNEKEKSNNENEFIVGTSADYPPFSFLKDEKIVGFEIDLMNEICKKIGKDPKYENMTFEGLLGSLISGKVNAVIASMAITEDRGKKVSFSAPYHSSDRVIISKSGKEETVSDLAGKTVGVQSGTSHEIRASELKKEVKDLKIQSMQKMGDLIQALKNGQVDAIVIGKAEAESIKFQFPELVLYPIKDKKEEFGIAIAKGNDELVKKINDALADLEKSGKMLELQKKWFSYENEEQNSNKKSDVSNETVEQQQSLPSENKAPILQNVRKITLEERKLVDKIPAPIPPPKEKQQSNELPE